MLVLNIGKVTDNESCEWIHLDCMGIKIKLRPKVKNGRILLAIDAPQFVNIVREKVLNAKK